MNENKKDEPSMPLNSSNKKAYILAIISSITLVLMQIILKQLTCHFGSGLILGIRGSLLFISNLLLLWFKEINIHLHDPKTSMATIKRAIVSALTMSLYLSSIKYIPLGVANALFNTRPIMTFFIEAIYYKKKVFSNYLNLIMIIISFLGVVLVIQPSFIFGATAADNYFFYFVVLFSAFTGSFSMIFLHDLKDKVTQLVVLQYGYFFHASFNYLMYIINENDHTKTLQYISTISFDEIIKICLLFCPLVALAFTTQLTLAKATYLSTPGLVMPFSYVSVIFGCLIDVVFLDAKYNFMTVIGMIMASFGLFSKFFMLFSKNKQIQSS